MHHTVPYPLTEPRTETGHQSRILPALHTVAAAISRWEWLRLFLTPSPLRFGQRPAGPGTANRDHLTPIVLRTPTGADPSGESTAD